MLLSFWYTCNMARTDANPPNVVTGSGAPTITPERVGDIYIDLLSQQAYQAIGVVDANSWKLTTSISGGRLDNWSATTDPGVTDDANSGYEVGSVWLNTVTAEAYRCVDAAVGAAVWIITTLSNDDLATVAFTGDYNDLINKPTGFLTQLLDDLSPQLAANLDMNGNDIDFGTVTGYIQTSGVGGNIRLYAPWNGEGGNANIHFDGNVAFNYWVSSSIVPSYDAGYSLGGSGNGWFELYLGSGGAIYINDQYAMWSPSAGTLAFMAGQDAVLRSDTNRPITLLAGAHGRIIINGGTNGNIELQPNGFGSVVLNNNNVQYGGGNLQWYNNFTAAAGLDGDVGSFSFFGNDSAGVKTRYVNFYASYLDNTTTSDEGAFHIQVRANGANNEAISIYGLADGRAEVDLNDSDLTFSRTMTGSIQVKMGIGAAATFGDVDGIPFGGSEPDGFYINVLQGGEASGMKFDGDTVHLWSPGDTNGILALWDEDDFPGGTIPAYAFETGQMFIRKSNTNFGIRISATLAASSNKTLNLPNITGDILARSQTINTSATTLTPAGDAIRHEATLYSLAAGLTINAPSGTASHGNMIMFMFRDSGSAQTLSWNAIYRGVGVTLPTTTVAGKVMHALARYNAYDAKWDVIGVNQLA